MRPQRPGAWGGVPWLVRRGCNGGGQGQLGVAMGLVANDSRDAAQEPVGIRRSTEVTYLGHRQTGREAQMSGDGCMAAAEIGRLRRMLQEPLARRGFHLGIEHGNLADHHIGMRQLAREQCVARGFVWQRKVPHLQPSAPLAQGMGDLRKHRSGPRPRAQLLQAAFVDVYERYAYVAVGRSVAKRVVKMA